MRHVGVAEQQILTPTFRADGVLAAGGTPQLVLPHAAPRSSVLIQNTSASDTLTFEFGSARATATITSGVVTSVTVTNAGFGFTYPPIIWFLGGGKHRNGAFLGLGYPNQPSPANFAVAHCVMTGAAGAMSVASIAIDNGGSNYVTAPYVQIMNDPNDPIGAALPSATSGFQLYPGQSLYEAHSIVTTDQISVYGATTGDSWFCRFTT
jgi:hypothetical protein